jgi:hypothetical protein
VNLLEIIKFLETGDDVDAQLEAFDQLNASVTEQDLPVLTEAMKSETSNFWVRELLAEPICRLGGAKAISELMAALRRNFDEGHDNDGFQAFLADLAESDPIGVRAELEKLRKTANKAELEDIQWLLEFCQ